MGTWNKVLRTLLPVEQPLLASKLDACRSLLSKGLGGTLTWSSDSLDDYIHEVLISSLAVDTLHTWLVLMCLVW